MTDIQADEYWAKKGDVELFVFRKRLADETGQPVERVAKDTDRNYWMGPEEAKEYGIVAHIVDSIDKVG